MKLTDYKEIKELDAANNTNNVTVLLVNGTPALRMKKYSPDTGELLNDEMEIGLDVVAMKKQAAELQSNLNNLNELIKDAKALK